MEIIHDGFTFKLDKKDFDSNLVLIKKVLNSESISNEGKQQWIDSLKDMNKNQIDRLNNILDKEINS